MRYSNLTFIIKRKEKKKRSLCVDDNQGSEENEKNSYKQADIKP